MERVSAAGGVFVGRELGYADAVKLLGGVDSRVVALLDRLTGGLLLAASAGGGAFVLNLFEAKGELARLSGELVSGLSERMRGLGRFDRTQRLVAAHKVIVITAYLSTVTLIPRPDVTLFPRVGPLVDVLS